MIISGLLLTLSDDAQLAKSAEAALRARPEFTLSERSQRWLPVVIEVDDVRASRDLHDWLNALPGVDFVDVVQVNFEEEAAMDVEALGDPEESCVIARPHPGPLPQEREKPSPLLSKTCGWVGRVDDRSTQRKQTLFPLPGGEGQGEGESHTIRQAARAVELPLPSKRRSAAAVQDAAAPHEDVASISTVEPQR
jgi:hypothetical protein